MTTTSKKAEEVGEEAAERAWEEAREAWRAWDAVRAAREADAVRKVARLQSGTKKVRVCAYCGKEFIRTKGHRHCCSDECIIARIQAGSTKGAQATKVYQAKQKARLFVPERAETGTEGW